jgi:hypothetical protein
MAVAALLSACSTLLVDQPYDPAIEEGLNSYHQTASAFIKKMESYGRAPPAAVISDESRQYYADMTGLLSNLVVRAAASDPKGTCPVSAVSALGLDGLLAGAVEQIDQTPKPNATATEFAAELKTALADFNAGTSDLAAGSCLTVTLKVVKTNHELMEMAHREEVYMGSALAGLEQSVVSQGVRIALLAARSNKP